MAVVSKTKIKSKNKQYYYRFKVDFGKDIKPEYKFASDIRFWCINLSCENNLY